MIKRATIQVSLVYEAVHKLRCHATADEIYEEIIKEHPTISKGTVYRNLKRLSQMGKILRVEIPGSPDRYDHMNRPHYHVLCEKCGHAFDVDMPYIPNLESSIKDAHGFAFTGHDILFRGICPECQKKAH